MSNFWDLTNIEEFEKKDNFIKERWDVSFYCKDCQKIVEVKRLKPDWYLFNCSECEWKNIAIWTLEGIKEKYKIKK